jgi:DNA-binding HxlR family transcriptional regulator
MPVRRDVLVTAVATYNRSHKPLPRSTVRLLEAMFASADACQLSLLALEDATGISHNALQTGLRALVAAGLIAKETGSYPSRYSLLLTPEGAA